MSNGGQASVEDILDSIKKVIARDNAESAQVVSPERAEYAAFSPGAEFGEDDAEFAQEDGNSLLTSAAQQSMRQNLEALSMMAQPSAKPQIVRAGETSLEGLVQDMLRPMLADWLDKNMPEIVEKMVQSEIQRITGKRG